MSALELGGEGVELLIQPRSRPRLDWIQAWVGLVGFSAIVRCHHGIGKVCLIDNWLCIPILFPVSPSQIANRKDQQQ